MTARARQQQQQQQQLGGVVFVFHIIIKQNAFEF
jgi:hypothetical protein